MYSHEKLILADTGEFDWTYIKRQALIRAQRTFGDCAPPVRAVRSEILNLKGYAFIMRARWRAAHGLADDATYVTVSAYGKQTDGVRRSAF